MAKLFQAQYPASRSRREVWLAVLLAHVLALWLINLYWPVQRIISQVVVQIFRPATPAASANSKPGQDPMDSVAAPVPPTLQPALAPLQRGITQQRSLRSSTQLSLPTLTLEASTPLQTTSQLPAFKPSRKRAQAAAAQPVPAATASAAAVDAPIRVREEPILEAPQSIPAPEPLPIPAGPPAPTPTPTPATVSVPISAPIPAPAPAPISAPVTAPAPAPAPVPQPTPPPAPVPAPPAPAPAPAPAPVPRPPAVAVQPAPAPVAPPAPAAAIEAAPSNTNTAPASASAPSAPSASVPMNNAPTANPAASATPNAGAPIGAAAGAPMGSPTGSPAGSATGSTTGGATGAATGSATGATSGTPGIVSNPPLAVIPPAAASSAPRPQLNLNLPRAYPNTPPNALPRRSISEMANEQLRRERPDKLEQGIDSAKHLDCLKDAAAQGGENKINETSTGGLMNIFSLAKRTLEGKCAK